MEKLSSAEQLMDYISNMNRENSVCQFLIPGKGRFTLVLQEEDQRSIEMDVQAYPELKAMINESKEEYNQGKGVSTSEFLKSFTIEDFR